MHKLTFILEVIFPFLSALIFLFLLLKNKEFKLRKLFIVITFLLFFSSIFNSLSYFKEEKVNKKNANVLIFNKNDSLEFVKMYENSKEYKMANTKIDSFFVEYYYNCFWVNYIKSKYANKSFDNINKPIIVNEICLPCLSKAYLIKDSLIKQK